MQIIYIKEENLDFEQNFGLFLRLSYIPLMKRNINKLNELSETPFCKNLRFSVGNFEDI